MQIDRRNFLVGAVTTGMLGVTEINAVAQQKAAQMRPARKPDWLIDPTVYAATVTRDGKQITLSNGLVRRVFSLEPNAAMVALDNLMTGESELRSVRPEAEGTCVLDYESGLANKIRTDPWQTDTCIGGWHYSKQMYIHRKYKSAKTVIDLLVDIVSQNGNLLLNIPLPNNGVPDSDEMQVLEGITAWMKVNSEGIYGTRPWKIYGEGPSIPTAKPLPGAAFNEKLRKPLTAEDFSFTTKGPEMLYVFVMGWPDSEVVIQSLGIANAQNVGRIENVELLGYGGKLAFKQEAQALRVKLPAEKPSDYGVTLKVKL